MKYIECMEKLSAIFNYKKSIFLTIHRLMVLKFWKLILTVERYEDDELKIYNEERKEAYEDNVYYNNLMKLFNQNAAFFIQRLDGTSKYQKANPNL